MTNHDRLLQFLYDSKKLRRDALTDLANSKNSFYFTQYDNEKLIYVSNGGGTACLFVFTLRGRFKYNIGVDLPNGSFARKNKRRLQFNSEIPAGHTGSREQPTLVITGSRESHLLGDGDALQPDVAPDTSGLREWADHSLR